MTALHTYVCNKYLLFWTEGKRDFLHYFQLIASLALLPSKDNNEKKFPLNISYKKV